MTAHRRLRLAVEIVATYVQVRVMLRRVSAPEAVRRLRTPPLDALAEPARVQLGRQLARATVRVISRLPGDSRCLTRSLVVTRLLARRGVDSVLVFSVRGGERFEAHAWVEVDATPILTPGDRFHAELMRV